MDIRGEAPDKKVLLMAIGSPEEGEQSCDSGSVEGEMEAMLLLPGTKPPAHSAGVQ